MGATMTKRLRRICQTCAHMREDKTREHFLCARRDGPRLCLYWIADPFCLIDCPGDEYCARGLHCWEVDSEH